MPISHVECCDCMDFMAKYPNKYFDLACVDPPYGIEKQISIGGGAHTKSKSRFHSLYNNGNKWDIRPGSLYFKELFRVSVNQIICGGNYFVNHLPISRGWIIWDKIVNGVTSINNELFFSSFDIAVKTFRRCHGLDKGFMNVEGTNIHPTQKPLALYNWLLKNYANPGDKILDTHMGSGSSRIAAYKLGFDFWGCELDKDYFNAAEKRFREAINEPLFQTAPTNYVQQKLF